MYLTTEVKKSLFKKHGKTEKDSGSAESQVALFTHRISHLTKHLATNKKDKNTQKALIDLVGQRKAMLDYLKNNYLTRYRKIIKDLELRK